MDLSFRKLVLLFCLLGLALVPGVAIIPSASAAPITFNTALPVSEGAAVLREQLIFSSASSSDTRTDQATALTIGGYGVTPKLAVFGTLPFIHVDTNVGVANTSSSALGDATLFSRYEAYRRDRNGATTRLAPLIGVRVPTGEEGETGNGSVDIFGGLVATFATTDFNLGSQILYTANREANGLEIGDTLALDVSWQRRIWPKTLSASTRGFLFGVLEGNLTWQDDTRLDGVVEEGSSGARFSISPGVQYVTQRWIADIAATIPVKASFSGDLVEPDYSVQTSIRINF